MQPSSEAYEAEDRCFRVSLARRLNPTPCGSQCYRRGTVLPQQKCSRPHLQQTSGHTNSTTASDVGTEEVSFAGMQQWRDVSQTSYNGAKVCIEQEVPALTRVVEGQREHARMDLVFNLNGSVTYLDVHCCSLSLATRLWSQQPAPDQDTWPKELKSANSTDTPHINFVPFILETTGRPGPDARKFTSTLMRDADSPPLAIRDTWSAVQSVLRSAISNNNSQPPLRDLRCSLSFPVSLLQEPRFLNCCALVFEAKASFVCGMVF